ncbi:MAG: EAL domain-containing protein, partial [Gammaproteobacteria bacterium]|nr:EAL domain-containing protein [Gammaproteobacteria bacterium]
ENIMTLLSSSGLPANYLELEITESAIMQEPERALEILNKLDKMGIKLSIDDFGTGYTSLSHLNTMPIDEIKIDMSFVRNMLDDNNNMLIVQSIIKLAHNMGYEVVAEGVENSALLESLAGEGCDTAQGKFIGSPLEAEEFEQWLESSAFSRANEKLISQSQNKIYSEVIPIQPK